MSYQEDIQELNSKVDGKSVDFLEFILRVAFKNNFSDIHIDPNERGAVVRFRFEGDLISGCEVSITKYQEIILLIKVGAELKIDDHYAPKDGSFDFFIEEYLATARVSILHTEYGENAVMRIMARVQPSTLEGLGFDSSSIETIKSFIQKPGSLVVVSGPTGSGKSTTLYALLDFIKNTKKNIITIEDPVEFKISGIRQVDLSRSHGVGFKDMLRSVLRQDPDIIMVGEIRDKVTAELVLESSLTGHVVFSSLHLGNIKLFERRLISMGVPAYLIEAVPTLVIGQELVRTLCVCKKRLHDGTYISAGCQACNHSGFKGRTIIYELSNQNISKKECALDKAIDGSLSLEDAFQF